MKENRIISFVGFQASLILANTSENNYSAAIWLIISALYLIRFVWLIDKK